MSGIPYIFIKASNWFDDFKKFPLLIQCTSFLSPFLKIDPDGFKRIFRRARYWLFLYIKLLWILADMGDEIDSVSLCSGFVKKIMNTNSYLAKATHKAY
ncbi:hypothetical protein Hpkin68_09130 [Helicobacter pylori]